MIKDIITLQFHKLVVMRVYKKGVYIARVIILLRHFFGVISDVIKLGLLEL